jgi:hypothetical protein
VLAGGLEQCQTGERAIKMPKDGMASAEMTDAYRGALAKAIEQALVVLRTETK